ncbi:MAG: hypothetical protein CVT98_02925 [Bacteroidetes bacterium HGW-Bacteroidetes-15]|nr:MAG: hypothetical protein CVT98_02925 [Bacteroidetes bacterium HGW-Bacteroidetes-15]
MLQGIKNTAKSSIIYGLGNISTKLVGIVLLPLYTNTELISIEEFGVLGVVDVSIQILVAVFGLSLYQAFFRWYWDSKYISERKSIFFTIFSFLALLVGISVVGGFFVSNSLSTLLFNNAIYANVVFYMLVSSSLQILSQLPLSYMRLEEKPIYYTITNLSRLIVSLLLTVIFITKMGRGLEGIYEAQILGNIFFLLITSRYIFNRIKGKFNFAVLKEMLEYSLPLTIASVSGIALATLDRYVLNYKATMLDVGIYTLAFRIANTIRVFIVHSIQLAVAPTIFRLMNHPNNKAIYSRIMTYFTLLVIYASLGLSIFGFEILTIFSTDDVYLSAYKLIPILALGILFGTAKDVAINGLNIVKKTKIVSYIVLPLAVFHLGLNFTIIPILGVYGAAIASAVSQGIFLLVVLYFAQKYYPIPFEYKRILLSLLLAVILFIVSNQLTPLATWPKILVKLLLVASFPFILWIFSFLKEDEKQWVNGGIRKIKGILGF